MQADAILAPRDLGRVRAALGDCGDDDGIAGLPGGSRDDDTVTDPEMRVGGEAAVYRDGACLLRRRSRQGDGEQEKGREPNDHGDAEGARTPRVSLVSTILSAAERRWPSAPCR